MAMDHINGHFCWTCGPGPLLKNPPKGPLWVWVWESCCGVCLAVVAMGSRNHLRVQLAWWCGEGAVLPTLHCPLSCVVYLFILLLSYSQWALPAVNRPCSVQTESCKKWASMDCDHEKLICLKVGEVSPHMPPCRACGSHRGTELHPRCLQPHGHVGSLTEHSCALVARCIVGTSYF